ncbi:MAG: hypothetical protein ACLQVI_42625 [Polyangiaceae bacterium]
MATRKVTISLEAGELAWIEARARRLNSGNLSAAFVDGVHALRRREALEDFLRMSKAPRLTSDEVAAVLAEVRGTDTEPKRARRKARASSAA